MRRLSHDLPGVTQRLAKLGDVFEVEARETAEYWKDEKGRNYFQQHTSDVRPNLNLLVSAMAETIELFEVIGKKLQDPDH